MADSVFVRGLEFEGNHGYTAAERRGTRRFRVDLELSLSLDAPANADALRANAMLGAGQLAQNNGDIASAGRYFDEVLAVRRRLGDQLGEARALADLGCISALQVKPAVL